MKAIIINKYGDLNELHLGQVKDLEPNKNEILIKVKAFTIAPLDTKIRNGNLKFILKRKFPMILGGDFSGTIVNLDKDIKNFSIGDEVMGATDPFKMNGPFAEYVKSKPDQIVKKPIQLSFTEAAALPIAAMSSLQSLRDLGKLKQGQNILILGAAGAVGHLAVQMARNMGAKITAVCRQVNADFVKSCGADYVIDYEKEQVFKEQNTYDIIFDTVAKYTFKDAKLALKKEGIYINTMPSPSLMIRSLFNSLTPKKLKVLMLKANPADLAIIKEWSANESIKVHLDKIYTGLESIHEATKYQETGHVRGKIAIEIG
ncbi:MAG: NAD(P)-dependent alcohol dehydrogenase [Saprospiraceae bacterium]